MAFTKDLFASVMLMGVYSLLSASFFVLMDAVDVAFTEAAVGAGISTILMVTVLSMAGRFENRQLHHPRIALFVVLITGVMLVYGTFDMPAFGDPNAPVQTHVAPYYLQQSAQDIDIPNVVTSVLASYRGFDTFGEVVVVFTAVIGVLAMLEFSSKAETESGTPAPMYQHKILRIVGKILIPPIMLFALYVQFHGEYGPGGGFQAGVIFAAAIILHAMLFGVETTRKVVSMPVVKVLAALGVLIYGSTGVVAMLNGGRFLEYNTLAENPVTGQHVGIIIIELGVGITVATAMMLIFLTFARRVGKTSGESA
ncbi:Na(+)/H(+) antiporter subunit B [Kangiella sp. M94]